MKKKGTLGTLALIFGIAFLVSGILQPFFPATQLKLDFSSTNAFSIEEIIGSLLRIIYIIAYIPTLIIGIIAIAKNSNRKGAIIGLILAHIAWIAPIIVRALIK